MVFRVLGRLLKHVKQSANAERRFAAFPAARVSAPTTSRWVPVVAVGLGSAWLSTSETPSSDALRLAYMVPSRLVRDVWTASVIVLDYKLSLRGLEGSSHQQELASCHQRSADRLLALCFANGGIYIKLGQHIGQLDHLLPAEYVTTMRGSLLDRCPTSPYDEVAAIIQQDLGAPPTSLFASFDPHPFASASLAQVHVATAHDGRKLAVKVQHPGLRDTCTADIATIQALVSAAARLFPGFTLQWLVEEVRESLPRELSFTAEAANAERCRRNISGSKQLRGRVVVPQILHELTSERVLTMEFMEGAPVAHLPSLHAAGVPPKQLARLIAQTFSEMVFIHGYVHCDPHAANMLARMQDGRVQLVLLDHGLYRQMDDSFRVQYAGLWHALIFADVDAIRQHSTAMNAGHAVPLFAGMLTQRPWDELIGNRADKLIVPRTKEERAKLSGYAAQYASEIAELLPLIPPVLLLLLKTNDCLRAVDNALGQPANTLAITARSCTLALGQQRLLERPGWRSRLAVAMDVAAVELRVSALLALTWLRDARRWLLPRKGSALPDSPTPRLE